MAFARQFDPQPYHVDGQKADRERRAHLRCLHAPSGRRDRHTVRLRATVIEAQASKSRPDRGRLTLTYEVSDAAGELVIAIIRRRLAAAQ